MLRLSFTRVDGHVFYGKKRKRIKNLDQKKDVCEAYDNFIKDQLENNAIEEVTNTEINLS